MYTSRDPPISIGGARKRVLNKTVSDRKGGSPNLNEKFEQEIRTRNSNKKSVLAGMSRSAAKKQSNAWTYPGNSWTWLGHVPR